LGARQASIDSTACPSESKDTRYRSVRRCLIAPGTNQYCGAANYGTPFCTYPWYPFNSHDKAFTYGGDYPGTTKDFGQAQQFQQRKSCTSPLGGFPQYCSTFLVS
jgi:hypothetical protein